MSGRQFAPDLTGMWQNEFKFIILFWFLVNTSFVFSFFAGTTPGFRLQRNPVFYFALAKFGFNK